MLEETISLYAFPSHNTAKSEHTNVKSEQIYGSNRRSIANGSFTSAIGMNLSEVGLVGHFLQSEQSKSFPLTEHPVQRRPNSISKNVASEALETDISEQCPPLLGSGENRTQLLNGWKEIANYMDRGIRTVQRWEAIGLPVRRVEKNRRAPVIALADDLDAWARSLHVPLLDRIEELRATISSLEAQIRSLKRQLRERNHPAHVDKTPTPRAITQLSENDASASRPRSRPNNGSRPTLNGTYGSVA